MITAAKSFQVTNILLVASAILTGLESVRADKKAALSLQISTIVCVIAAYHYNLMITSPDNQTIFRYLDWYFTTPLLLLELCILMEIDIVSTMPFAVLLNLVMLSIGFWGELNNGNRILVALVGSIPLGVMYNWFSRKTKTQRQRSLLRVFFGVWTVYGIVHVFPDESLRAISFNVLDIISKAAFGGYIFALSH